MTLPLLLLLTLPATVVALVHVLSRDDVQLPTARKGKLQVMTPSPKKGKAK